MNKTRKRFVLYAMLAVFVLLTVLLAVINVTNYTMAAEDADQLTLVLSENRGQFRTQENEVPEKFSGQPGQGQEQQPGQFSDQPGQFPGGSQQFPGGQSGQSNQFPGGSQQFPGGQSGQFPGGSQQFPGGQSGQFPGSSDQFPGGQSGQFPGGSEQIPGGQSGQFPGGQGSSSFPPTGPNSPDMQDSLRYFTARFESDGSGSLTAYNISAVTEEEALNWAASLTKEGTGWTRGSYRYRVWQDGDATLVTIIDQSRELTPCRRILIISLCGLGLGLLISFLFLHFIGKRLFAPLEEADRKQKQFITDAEKDFKVPLTAIDGAAELIEREQGPSEYTTVIHRQVRKMTGLVSGLGNLAIFEEETAPCDLSAILTDLTARYQPRFAEKGMRLDAQITPDVTVSGSEELLRRIGEELLGNALKFGGPQTDLTLSRDGQRVRLTVTNDALLADGNYEHAFDRFTRLPNAEGIPGAGLGLASVKDGVKALKGRVSARAEAGKFILQLSL